jgi:hypothetical protein
MKIESIAKLLLLPLVLSVLSCQPIIIYGNLYAVIAPKSDREGRSSSVVNVYYTEFNASYSVTPGKLTLTFSTPDGDEMIFGLPVVNNQVAVNTYKFDSTGATTFSAKFSDVTGKGAAVTYSDGYVNVKSISFSSSNALKSVSGDFRLNFTEGGNGEGTFNVTVP